MRIHEPISSWQDNDEVQAFALVSHCEQRQGKNGRPYFDLTLVDRTGSLAAKIWSDSEAIQNPPASGDFVKIKGRVKSYQGTLQLTIERCRLATEADRAEGFDPGVLIPSTPEDIDDLWIRLTGIFPPAIRQPDLARLAAETIQAYGPRLREHPAAKAMHHAYLGGLLEHTVSMAELAIRIADHYPELDRDLLLLGVLFHDLGKLDELGAMPANDYTLVGRLVGHVVIGRDLVRERCAAIEGFPTDLQLLLEHLVLSHQGKREFGTPVEPMTPEALALHFIDDLDSKINQFRNARRDSPAAVQYLKGLGRYVYLPPVRVDA